MKAQIEFCETILEDLARLFPDYPRDWSTSNVWTSKPAQLLTITMPAELARRLIDAYEKTPRHETQGTDK